MPTPLTLMLCVKSSGSRSTARSVKCVQQWQYSGPDSSLFSDLAVEECGVVLELRIHSIFNMHLCVSALFTGVVSSHKKPHPL